MRLTHHRTHFSLPHELIAVFDDCRKLEKQMKALTTQCKKELTQLPQNQPKHYHDNRQPLVVFRHIQYALRLQLKPKLAAIKQEIVSCNAVSAAMQAPLIKTRLRNLQKKLNQLKQPFDRFMKVINDRATQRPHSFGFGSTSNRLNGANLGFFRNKHTPHTYRPACSISSLFAQPYNRRESQPSPREEIVEKREKCLPRNTNPSQYTAS